MKPFISCGSTTLSKQPLSVVVAHDKLKGVEVESMQDTYFQ
jgi:hypothetical protein